MRNLIESVDKLVLAENVNELRDIFRQLQAAKQTYPDDTALVQRIDQVLARIRPVVQASQQQQPNRLPNDGTPPAAQQQPTAQSAGPDDGTRGGQQPNAPAPAAGPNVPQNLRFATRQAAQRALGPNVARAINSNGRPINGTTTIMIGNEYYAVPRATGTAPGQPTQVAAAQPQTVSESKKMNKKTITEASVNINGTAEEIAELMRMMQLAGAPGAKPVDATDINPGPKPCPICGKVHGPMPKPGGCGGAPMQGPEEPDMGDMIRMISKEEENEDGGFEDATTEPAEYTSSNAGDISDVIPDGNDLHKEKDAYPAVNGGDNAMRIKEQLYKALAEKKAKPDFLDVDGDGDKKEPMKKALQDKKKKK
jgi:hypothetical protein